MHNRMTHHLLRLSLSASLLLTAAAICSPVFAEDTQIAANGPSASVDAQANTAQSYVVGPGDTLHVVVFDEPGLEQRIAVSDSGLVHLFLVGDMRVAGLSADQVARSYENLLRGHYLVHPVANVTIDQSATMQVSVLGEVRNPGTFEIGTARNVLDIISLAGGLNDDADRRLTIKHRGTKADATEVFLPNNANDAIAQSVLVYPGDTVIVPKAGLVYVLGDVGRPGGYYMQRDSSLSVLQALGMAGGLLPNAAAPSSRIVRKDPNAPNGYTQIPLELRAIQRGKQKDIALQADDVIYVPFSYARNMIVQSPAILASLASAVIYTHP